MLPLTSPLWYTHLRYGHRLKNPSSGRKALQKDRSRTPNSRQKPARANYDALLGTVMLPNNIDRQEVDVGPVMADLLIPELAIGKRTILYAHGGGFTSGSRLSARNLCASIAHESACRLLLPEYRLAPEYPYPTALEDLYKRLCMAPPSGSLRERRAFRRRRRRRGPRHFTHTLSPLAVGQAPSGGGRDIAVG